MNNAEIGLLVQFTILLIFFGTLTIWQIVRLVKRSGERKRNKSLVSRIEDVDKSHKDLLNVIKGDVKTYDAAINAEVARRLATISDKELINLINSKGSPSNQ